MKFVSEVYIMGTLGGDLLEVSKEISI